MPSGLKFYQFLSQDISMGKCCARGTESGQVLMLIVLPVNNDREVGSKGNGPVGKAD